MVAGDDEGLKSWQSFSKKERRKLRRKVQKAFETPFCEGEAEVPQVGTARYVYSFSDKGGKIEERDDWSTMPAEQTIINCGLKFPTRRKIHD